MADRVSKADTAVEDAIEPSRPEREPERTGERAAVAGSPFRIYKQGQAPYVRWGSAGGAALVVLAGAGFIFEQMARLPFEEATLTIVRTVVTTVFLVGMSYLVFWLLGQHRGVVDFMIATEGEMKKVNWSSRREVIGATKVVIFAVLALGIVLFIVDLFFIMFFSSIGVLRIDILKSMFGGGSQ